MGLSKKKGGGKFTQAKQCKAGQSESKASNAKLDEPRQSPANPSRDNSSLGLPFGQSRKCIEVASSKEARASRLQLVASSLLASRPAGLTQRGVVFGEVVRKG